MLFFESLYVQITLLDRPLGKEWSCSSLVCPAYLAVSPATGCQGDLTARLDPFFFVVCLLSRVERILRAVFPPTKRRSFNANRRYCCGGRGQTGKQIGTKPFLYQQAKNLKSVQVISRPRKVVVRPCRCTRLRLGVVCSYADTGLLNESGTEASHSNQSRARLGVGWGNPARFAR